MKQNNATVDAGEVIRICDLTNDWIKTQIELEVEKWIQIKLKEDQRGFWEILFRRPPVYLTRPEVEKILHQEIRYTDGWVTPSPYNDICSQYGCLKGLSRKLKKLAEFSSSGQVNVTDDTIDQLVR